MVLTGRSILKIRKSPIFLLSLTAISIFLAEMIIMYGLSKIPSISGRAEMLIDSLFLILSVSPILYFFMFRPLVHYVNEQKNIAADLRSAIDEIKILGTLIPMCASCGKMRNDSGYWQVLDMYLKENAKARITHGICPDCIENLYPDYYDKVVLDKESA